MRNVIDLTNNKIVKAGITTNHRSITRIDGQTYYLKDYVDPIELIVYEFCCLLGIDCVHYKLASKNNKLYLISKSFRKEGCKYIRGGDLIDSFLRHSKTSDLKELNMLNFRNGTKNNLETIWLALANRYCHEKSKYDDIRTVMVNLLKQYFLMILIQDADFHRYNWEIEESKDHISLTPKFDNESAFTDMEIWGVPMGVSVDESFETTISSLDYFLNVTASEDIQLFLDLFYKATPDLLKSAIDTVKDKYDINGPIFDLVLTTYINHYEELSILLKMKGLKR